jgi:hypothetical protein
LATTTQDCVQLEPGTSARVWGHTLGAVATLTSLAAMLPLAHFVINTYSLILRVSRAFVDDVRFQLQSRKMLVHSADQVYRASQCVFGEELNANLVVRF